VKARPKTPRGKKREVGASPLIKTGLKSIGRNRRGLKKRMVS